MRRCPCPCSAECKTSRMTRPRWRSGRTARRADDVRSSLADLPRRATEHRDAVPHLQRGNEGAAPGRGHRRGRRAPWQLASACEAFAAATGVTDLTLRLSEHQTVSALHTEAVDAFACLVLAHGAGAGMRHRFMADVADGLAHRGVSTLRFQFPYMEAGSKRVDTPPLAHLTVRAAVAAAGASVPLFAGGKSFGGRMTSQAQAIDPLPGARGLVFFGFPLHSAGKPSVERASHLSDVRVPMLFLQGTKDALAEIGLLEGVVAGLK